MKLDYVAETALYVDDMDAARDFYVGVLGLEVLKDDSPTGRDLFLKCGRTGVFLFDAKQTKEDTGVVPVHGAIGAGHIAFGVPNEELDHWKQLLINKNIKIEKEVFWEHRGTSSIYFRDPSGNSLEFIPLTHWNM